MFKIFNVPKTWRYGRPTSLRKATAFGPLNTKATLYDLTIGVGEISGGSKDGHRIQTGPREIMFDCLGKLKLQASINWACCWEKIIQLSLHCLQCLGSERQDIGGCVRPKLPISSGGNPCSDSDFKIALVIQRGWYLKIWGKKLFWYFLSAQGMLHFCLSIFVFLCFTNPYQKSLSTIFHQLIVCIDVAKPKIKCLPWPLQIVQRVRSMASWLAMLLAVLSNSWREEPSHAWIVWNTLGHSICPKGKRFTRKVDY